MAENVSANDKLILGAIFNPETPYTEKDDVTHVESSDIDPFEGTRELELCKSLELEGVKCAEQNRLEEAVAKFTQSAQILPARPSPYNNRAQALRLLGNVDSALEDLNTAVRLSEGRGKVARQALTQRAFIRRLQGDEEGARADFASAADLGGELAKQQCIKLNPYAALCNSMLAEVMGKLRRGEPVD